MTSDYRIEPVELPGPRPTRPRIGGINWTPWIPDVPLTKLSAEQDSSLLPVQRKSSYYRILVHDPQVLDARTKVDNAIFHSKGTGAPREWRELAATASSLTVGCPVCISTHANFTAVFSKRREDVERLVAGGIDEVFDGTWNAIINASAQLAATPTAITVADIDQLRGIGLTELQISDVIHSAAFFAWANRLLLTIGGSSLLPGVEEAQAAPSD
jgi:uncharacterized peroxidase-related enzyme